MSERQIVVFTDGASKGNPGPGGWGVIIVWPDGRVTELGGGSAQTTNNKMELTGAIEALSRLRGTSGPVSIYTDSTYVIQGIRGWVHGWKRRGWKTAAGRDVLNRELWERLDDLATSRGPRAIAWHYVRGHVGIPGNERVDEIAATPGIDVLFIGTSDLSFSLGLRGDQNHPRLHDAVGRVVEAAKRHGKFAGRPAGTPEQVREYASQGFQLFQAPTDIGFVTAGAKRYLAGV